MKPQTVMKTITIGLIVASAPLLAQQQEIIVESRGHVDRSASGIPIDTLTVRHEVSYKDIDISTSSGAKVLKQRIEDAAKAACMEIDKLYPTRTMVTSVPECEKAAIDRAMTQANAAIAAAEDARHK